MDRLTPRTRRIGETAALSLIIITSTAAAILLTFFPCYATLCSEEYFLAETRIHLIIYYGFVILVGLALLMRQYSSGVRSLMGRHILNPLPLVGKRVTAGGLLFLISVLAVVGGPTALWWPAQQEFWGARADPLNWASAKLLLTITGVTGHYADILLGLLLIPVSRNSLIGHAFSLHQNSLLFAHKMVSYLFAICATAHGVSYIIYATDTTSEGDPAKEEAFATGNPAMTLSESKRRSEWFTMTTYTGIGALLPVLLIVTTSLPRVRGRHYNLFYYTHVLLGTAILAATCVHASTDLYLLVPGLLLWFVDLFRRGFCGEAGGLSRRVSATLENAGNGWLRISVYPTRRSATDVDEKRSPVADPLAYYYLTIPSISKLQNHAFTAAVNSSNESGPVFLLQRSTGKSQKKLDKEWTWRVGARVPMAGDSIGLDVRLEGPYPVHDSGFRTAAHIICVVGGTGVTGACSLARWWLDSQDNNNNGSRLTVLWTVRQRRMVEVREWAALEEAARSRPNMEMVAHVSSEMGRLDVAHALRETLGCGHGAQADIGASAAWVYGSGPDALMTATERACVEIRKEMGTNAGFKRSGLWQVQDISWYMAKWEV